MTTYRPNIRIGDPKLYYYDPEEPTKCINFFERYLQHTKGQHAGKKFLLLPWQKDAIHSLLGVRRRSDGKKRYRIWWLEGPKSLGKTPLIAGFFAERMFKSPSANPLLVSSGPTEKQAFYIYDQAAAMIRANDDLKAFTKDGRLEILKKEMRLPSRGAKWEVITGDSWSGSSPVLFCCDEIHELHGSDKAKLEIMEGNLRKIDDSLMILATNTGWDKTSVAGRWHDRCKSIEAGIVQDDSVYVSIYSAPDDADISDEKVWFQANPSIGHTMTLDDYRASYNAAKNIPAKLLDWRRLYAGQWVTSSATWLKVSDIGACVVRELPDTSEMPCYLGFDFGSNDDLVAASWMYVDEKSNHIFIESEQWVTHDAATRYQDSHGIDYYSWKEQGHITFVEGRCVGMEKQQEIAKHLADKAKSKPRFVQACVDRNKNDIIINALEQAGLTVESVSSQTSALNDACKDFETRILEGKISFLYNECFLWQLANVKLYIDSGGQCKPEKPGASRNYAGQRHKKMDTVMATMYALARARLLLLGQSEDKKADISTWDGTIAFV